MKHLKSLPTVQEFFETYATLAQSIKRSGYAAQIVSALTEIGGIYAASYSALLPIFPQLAFYIAAVIAIIGTAVIEIGLRVLLPHTVDAVLYRRFKGLYLPMTIAIWGCAVVLLGASGIISFSNSKTIVEEYTPEPEQLHTTEQDSTWQVERAAIAATFSQDSAMIAERYNKQITAERTAYGSKVAVKKTELSNLRRREARTGQSFATAKDNARAAIASLEAEQAGKIASLEASQAQELSETHRAFKDGIAGKERRYLAAVDSVQALNQSAIEERTEKVGDYGGGLGYFTIVCLFLLCAAVTLDRIHRKGSGIKESVELSQYDVSPSWWANLQGAVSERWNYAIQSWITAFADKTPPAPLPAKPSELYDPLQLANIQITLLVDQGDDDKVIYIQPKRRAIGFRSNTNTSDTKVSQIQEEQSYTKAQPKALKHQHQGKANTKPAESSCAVKEQGEYSLSDLTQRLKMYKKRLGSHTQKKIKLEQAGKKVPSRTLDAIENNRQWVEHYTNEIEQVKNREGQV